VDACVGPNRVSPAQPRPGQHAAAGSVGEDVIELRGEKRTHCSLLFHIVRVVPMNVKRLCPAGPREGSRCG
jgi:hypothetical protein